MAKAEASKESSSGLGDEKNKKMVSTPKVSIVVPVWNVENYLEECIQSMVNQTMEEIEIILIDDASSDRSLEIAREYEIKDKRIKLIAYEQNKSASQARKDGALLASGEYVMFMDGDDYLDENACEELYKIIEKEKVDIVHFGTKVICPENADVTRIGNLKRMLLPYSGRLEGKDVFEGCFVNSSYRFSIWNKIYSGKLIKKAFRCIQDGRFPKAQDLYAFFVLSYFAISYLGIPERSFYNYRFGAGITGTDNLNLAQFEKFCQHALVADGIESFAKQYGQDQYEEAVKKVRKDLLGDCVHNWYHRLSNECTKEGFDIMAKYWRADELVSSLCSKFLANRKGVADKVFGAQALSSRINDSVKTIGIFYYRYSLGGVQRVLSLLIPLYLSLGYKVIFFTDEYDGLNEYNMPEGVIRIILPTSITNSPTTFEERAKALYEHVSNYEIDVFMYHAASSQLLLFDLLLIKLMGIQTILTVHETAMSSFLSFSPELSYKPSVYKVADKVTVLSNVEKTYWRAHGVNALYVPNPMNNEVVIRDQELIEENTLLWIGRLDFRPKQYMDVISVMSEVIKEVPEAKMLVVGNDVTKGATAALENGIAKSNLQNHIELCGATNDVDQYYKRASVHVVTSSCESFPMTITESRAYGIPLVMYELPYLEILAEGKGYISVEQKNTKSMAGAIIKLLKDDKLRDKIGEDARESFATFASTNLKNIWKDVIQKPFEDIEPEQDAEIQNQRFKVFLKSMVSLYETCSKRLAGEVGSLRKQASANYANDRVLKEITGLRKSMSSNKSLQEQNLKLQNKQDALSKELDQAKKRIAKIEKSKSYRLGKTLTSPFRFIKKRFK